MAASRALIHPFLAATFVLLFASNSSSSVAIGNEAGDRNADGRGGASSLASIFSLLGFQEMSAAAPFMYESGGQTNIASAWPGPFTIFAPSDSSIDACSSCSLPLLLQEHTVPGLYTFKYLQSLPFGSRIQSLIHSRCLTVTKSYDATGGGGWNGNEKVFIGGVEVTRPDLHNDGYFVIHGLDGYVSHLSPLSCDVEKITSLSFGSAPEGSSYGSVGAPLQPQLQPPVDDNGGTSATTVMRVMLDDATLRLRSSGFSTLALALRIRYEEFQQRLQSMTIFALNDMAIFRLGHGYVQNLGFHIAPNRLLTGEELMSYPEETEIQTMEPGRNLVITSAGSDGDTLKINYVAVKALGFISNLNIVVHQIHAPFGHVGFNSSVEELRGRLEGSAAVDFKRWSDEHGDYGFEQAPVITDYDPVPELDDYRGL
uniref:FAS1 domain-containing protein n=1 Tax=Kalanchoe fedtschenkoi TaxID=63787 RepID=A0A7N0UDP0_KALFE